MNSGHCVTKSPRSKRISISRIPPLPSKEHEAHAFDAQRSTGIAGGHCVDARVGGFGQAGVMVASASDVVSALINRAIARKVKYRSMVPLLQL